MIYEIASGLFFLALLALPVYIKKVIFINKIGLLDVVKINHELKT